MISVGVDLAKRTSQFVALDEQGAVLAERKLPNNRAAVQKFLRGLPGQVQVACETCMNTYWLVDVVEEMGIPIRVGHALKIRLIAESRTKTDKIDAKVIADLARINFFPSIAIPPAEVRRHRELLRARIRLGRDGTRMKNRIHGVLIRGGVDYTRAQAVGAVAFQIPWKFGVSLRTSVA